MPVKAPEWFKTVEMPSLPVGSVLPCTFVDTDDAWLTVAAVVPTGDGSVWGLEVGVDDNKDGVLSKDEYGWSPSFIQEGNQLRWTLTDMRNRPPGSPRYFRARRVR